MKAKPELVAHYKHPREFYTDMIWTFLGGIILFTKAIVSFKTTASSALVIVTLFLLVLGALMTAYALKKAHELWFKCDKDILFFPTHIQLPLGVAGKDAFFPASLTWDRISNATSEQSMEELKPYIIFDYIMDGVKQRLGVEVHHYDMPANDILAKMSNYIERYGASKPSRLGFPS